MEEKRNGMAVAGFVLALCSAGLFAAGLLCLIGVMLTTFLSFVFGGMAGVAALLAIVFSAIGNYKARGEAGGAGLSMAGLILGTMVVTLVLAMTALLIVAAATALA
ncbi:MAG TPA: hypothetical protein IAB50_12960 [Candidatus Faecivicinus avistercoris]|nr:hypothetical protein [Candidatus Faecivicinus avistercoris]